MASIEEQVLDKFTTTLVDKGQVATRLVEAIRAELMADKGPSADAIAQLIRAACEEHGP
jgi:hypothetical protein